jgi:hypothetical protein
VIFPPSVFPALAYFAAASLAKINFIKIVTRLTRIFDDFAFADTNAPGYDGLSAADGLQEPLRRRLRHLRVELVETLVADDLSRM